MTKKVRMVMVMQDLKHLKIKLDEIPLILQKIGAERWCWINHNKDIDDDGNKVRDHIHILIKFENPRSINSIAKSFKVEPQYIEIWGGKNAFNNGMSYLIHETSEAISKYHYSDEEVKASFDFHKEMEEIRAKVKTKNKSKNTKQIIEKYGSGIITLNELEETIGVYGMAKNKRLIDNVTQLLNRQKYNEWKKNFKGKCKTFYIYGETQRGKTTVATWALNELKRITGDPYIILGSTRDPFQFYASSGEPEKFLLMDDLRPNVLDYSTMLKLFDPRPFGKVLPARYSDQTYVRAEVIFVTSPYSLKQFYDHTKIQDRNVDSFEQIKRRVIEIHFTKEISNKFRYWKPKFESVDGLINCLEEFQVTEKPALEDKAWIGYL